jgi:membrane protein
MVLCIAFLLLVSLVLSAVLSAFGPALTALLPGTVTVFAAQVLQGVASLLLITVLFMAIFRLLPEAEIAWRDVAVGGFATALLFVAGKFGIGFYLGRSDPGSAFGAAGSLAVVLLWIYYSAMILLLGAEFTQVWAQRRGRRIVPEPGARIITAARVPAAGSG